MNLTILKGSARFPAIHYSEDKIEKNRKSGLTGKDAEVELIAMRNFPVPDATFLPAEAKERFMLDWCSKSGVRVRQLHFAVSCRGQENTESELKAAAEYLLDNMGYSRCPALFYLHRDTDDLHLHVVTTKSDENGYKVPDWHNGQRFRECLDRYEGQNIEQNADRAILLASSYHFTESRHFISLMASMGFSTNHEEEKPDSPAINTSKEKQKSNNLNISDMLFLYRNRKKVASVSMDKIKKMIEANRQKTMTEAEIHRKKELSAIMRDYRRRETKDFYTGKKPASKADLRIEQKVRAVNSIHNDQMAKRGIMRNDLYQMALFQSDMKKEFGLDVIYNFDRTGVPNGFIVLDHQAKRVWRGSELGFKFREFLRPDEKALREYINEGRCSEALSYKDKDWDEGFNGAVAIETRLAKGGTVFLFYGRFNIALLPKDLGKDYHYYEIPIRGLNHDEMKTLEKRGVEVRVHQSVYDSIPFNGPFDADGAHSTGLTNDEDRNENATTKEGDRQPILNIQNVGEVVERTIHTASSIATDVTNSAIDVLDNLLETPESIPAIGGGMQPKDLEDKERKKKRKKRNR